MDAESFNLLTVMIRKRQLELWHKIVKEFEVEDSLNTQVQNWIREDVIAERAYDRHRSRAKPRPYGQGVPRGGTQGALHH